MTAIKVDVIFSSYHLFVQCCQAFLRKSRKLLSSFNERRILLNLISIRVNQVQAFQSIGNIHR